MIIVAFFISLTLLLIELYLLIRNKRKLKNHIINIKNYGLNLGYYYDSKSSLVIPKPRPLQLTKLRSKAHMEDGVVYVERITPTMLPNDLITYEIRQFPNETRITFYYNGCQIAEDTVDTTNTNLQWHMEHRIQELRQYINNTNNNRNEDIL